MKADFTLFFLVVFVGAALWGWEWPNIAKIMPVYVAAIPGLILVLMQLYRDATGWERSGNRRLQAAWTWTKSATCSWTRKPKCSAP